MTYLLLFLLNEIIEGVVATWNFSVIKTVLGQQAFEIYQFKIIMTLSYHLSHNPVIDSVKAEAANF